ncbi:MAG: DUF1385 domain-containing protein [Chloroflexota bacterium]
MNHPFPRGIRVGGSALPNGVMMLTPLAAAIARESPCGGFTIDAFPLPARKPHVLEKLPFIRILPKLIGQMALVARGWKPQGGKLPIPLIGAAVLLGVISMLVNLAVSRLPAFWHASASSLLQLGLFFTFIALTRLIPQFGRIWRFHGGEHQAIAAYEAGMDLTVENARTRVLYHPRCGTNLATLALLLMIPGMVTGSIVSGVIGYIVTLAVPLPALCIAFEMVMMGQKRMRAILWPGLAFQRLTVAMPTPTESLAGIMALQAVLVQHEKVEALRAGLATPSAVLEEEARSA